MGYILFVISKIAAIIKIVAVKNCGNIASGPKNSLKINILRSLGCIAVGSCVCIFSGFRAMDGMGLWISVLSGVSNAMLLFFWILAATCAPTYFVEVFCMIGGVVLPLVLSPVIIEGESVQLIQWIGSALLIVAALCLSKRGGGRITPKTVLIAIMAGLGNMGTVMSQKLYNTFSDGTVADFQLATYVVCAALLALLLLIMNLSARCAPATEEVRSASPLRGKVLLFIGIAIVMMYTSQFLSTVASGYIPSSVFYPLSYVITMPLVFAVDVIIYKEKITPMNVIGILLVTAAGVLINLK